MFVVHYWQKNTINNIIFNTFERFNNYEKTYTLKLYSPKSKQNEAQTSIIGRFGLVHELQSRAKDN